MRGSVEGKIKQSAVPDRGSMKYPYSQLHHGKSCVVTTAGPHIKVLNSECVTPMNLTPNSSNIFRNGSLLASTDLNDAELLKSGPIRHSCVDREYKHLVTVGEDKKLKVWQLEGLKVLSER